MYTHKNICTSLCMSTHTVSTHMSTHTVTGNVKGAVLFHLISQAMPLLTSDMKISEKGTPLLICQGETKLQRLLGMGQGPTV